MVENLTEMMNREWNLVNSDTNDYIGGSNNGHSHHSRLLSRKVSDNSNNQQHQSTNNSNDVSSLAAIRTPKPLSNRMSLDMAYDTDSALGTSGNRSKHHHHSTNNYEYLISPRLPIRRQGVQPSKQVPAIPLQQRLSHKIHINASQNYEDKDVDTNYEDDIRRRHRLSRRSHQTSTPTGNHGARGVRSTALVQHGSPLAATPSVQPLRIIFMRHGERANQALGPDWFNKAFRTNTYKAYDQNLPIILPKRRFDQAYEFDAPLTGQQIDFVFLKFNKVYYIF
jgi:hypothetical protein